MNKIYRKLYCLVVIYSLSSGITNGQIALSNMNQVNNLIDDVVFKSLLQVDLQKAETVHLSSKKCFIPMVNYVEKNIIGKGILLDIDDEKVMEFIVRQIKAGVSERALSKKLITSLRKEEFKAGEQIPAKLTDEK